MAKNKISEFSSVASNNTDIGNIDINEGCAPANVNNAIRELMAQLKDQQDGTDGDNLTVGGNLSVTGTSTLTGNTTVTGTLTANGGLTGNVTGNLTGNVTGNATGNLISVSNAVNAGSFIVGNTYVIATLGSPTPTDFTAIGASSNTVGVRFTATGVGSGNGTATTFTGRAVNVTGVVAIENGGTGATSFTQNAVILGNGTSAPTSVLPSTNNNVLTSKAGATVTAGSFVIGTQYTILTLGSPATNWVAIGASSATVGVVFTATGVGTSNGTATTNIWSSETAPVPSSLSTSTGSAPSYSARAFVNFDGVTITTSAATYAQSGTTVTVTLSSHGYRVGDRVSADDMTGTAIDGMYTVATVPDANTFTYTAGTSLTTGGTVNVKKATIRASSNINSIAYFPTGVYGINFTTAMPNANYACMANCSSQSGTGATTVMINRSSSDFYAPTAQSIVIFTRADSGGAVTAEYVNAVIFA